MPELITAASPIEIQAKADEAGLPLMPGMPPCACSTT